MSASKKLMQAAAGNAGDAEPQYNDATVLLLSGDGTDGAQNNTFDDASSNNYTVTRTGNTTQGSFTPFSQDEGKWGNYFDGTGDYLTAPANTDFQFGSGDFTIEFFWYPTNFNNYQTPIDMGYANSGSYIVQNGSDGKAYFYTQNSGIVCTSATAYSLNSWNHLVVSRSGSTLSIFLNGIRTITATNSDNLNANYPLGIGGTPTHSVPHEIDGYLSNVRLVKGTAVYDPTLASITVPTEPLTDITNTSLLTCQSNRFVDNSSNAHSITVNGDPEVAPFSPFAQTSAYSASTDGGSLYFDGTDDDLTVGSASNWTFLSNNSDHTFEFWFYQTNTSERVIFATHHTRSGTGVRWAVDGTDIVIDLFVNNSGNGVSTKRNMLFQKNAWNYVHVKAVRSTSTSQIYTITNGLNGRVQTITTAVVYSSSSPGYNLHVGRGTDDGSDYAGYIMDLRIKSVAETFSSLPTAPLTSDANTELLLSGQDAGIYDLSGKNVVETVGNAQIDTAVKKYGTGSMQFDGTGDYIKVPPTHLFEDISSGAFTIEAWINIADNNNRGFFHLADEYFASYQDGYVVGQNGADRLFVSHSNTFTQQASIGYSLNTWFHFALVRNSSGNLKLYVDGVEKISVTDTTNVATTHLLIGGYYTTSNLLNGYIDDFRITKGVARYTEDFTPPTAALTAHDEE